MAGPLILIADDSMVVRAVIRKQLSGEGYEIAEVDNGDAVLARCRQDPPDVVLLDVEMPGMDGYEVLAVMQGDPALAGIPVVFLSGRVSAEDVANGLRLGAHDYLRKPVETGELIARVTAALRTKALHDQLRRDNAQLREAAHMDPLTGILDLRGLQDKLRRFAETAKRESTTLAGIVIDVDGLDAVNARYGRAAGDEVLRQLARVVSGRLGASDAVGRAGPDELLALLPGTSLTAATALAREIQTMFESAPVLFDGGRVPVTVTVGTATTETGDVENLVHELANALAAAKHRPATPEPEPEPPQFDPTGGGYGEHRVVHLDAPVDTPPSAQTTTNWG